MINCLAIIVGMSLLAWDEPKDDLQKGIASLEAFKSEEAIRFLTRSIEKNPTNPEAYYYRGMARRELGLIDDSIQDYNSVLKLDPKHARALIGRGSAFISKREWDHGIADYTTAIKFAPKDFQPLHLRGSAYYQIGDYSKAVDDFEKAATVAPDSSVPHRDLTWFFATCPEGNFRNGKMALEHAIKRHKLVGRVLAHDTLQGMAAAYAELGRFSDAAGVQCMAIELLNMNKLTPLVKSAERRLANYNEKKPLRYESTYDWTY